MALKLRATRPPAQGCGTKSVPRQGHNTPLPLERSPPASFKRLLGSGRSVSPGDRERLFKKGEKARHRAIGCYNIEGHLKECSRSDLYVWRHALQGADKGVAFGIL